MRTSLSVLGLLLFSLFAHAQKEGNIWYFGERAGLDFNSGSPVPLSDGAMTTNEGCASISNQNGQLLFYTDGINVWDRTQKRMPNGTNLAGHPSSTQSGIIVPKPLNPGIYYVFTVDAEAGTKGLEYSVVDMSLNGGLGDVTQKNIKLRTPVCEKLTAVQHANKKDVWVIAHDWNSANYVIYLVTENGVSGSPKIVNGNQMMNGDIGYSVGYLKVSPGGNYVASAVKGATTGYVNLYTFDNNTGDLKKLTDVSGGINPYGVEFSPDNTKLYISIFNKYEIWQLDMTSNEAQKILDSKQVVELDLSASITALQLGPDRKIYVSRNGSSKLGVIRFPNESGASCGYVREGLTLTTGLCRSGLPTFVQSFFDPVSGIAHSSACKGQPVTFQGRSNIVPSGWAWDFGDPASGAANYSSKRDDTHTFNQAGIYRVKLVIIVDGVSDTVTENLKVLEAPSVNLGKDMVRCIEEKVKLDAQNPGMNYLWSTNDTTQEITVDTSGRYWVRVSNGSCTASDTVNILMVDPKTVTMGKDTIACKGDTVILSSSVPQARHAWSTGDTTGTIYLTESKTVVGFTIIGSCLVTDTIHVTFIDPPHVDLGPTRMLCEGDTTELDAGNTGARYLWSTGQTSQKIKIYRGGEYWVHVSGGDCSSGDTVKILHCKSNIAVPNAFTPNADKLNDRFRVFGTDIAKGTLTITNRWGEKVYQSDDIFNGWDGTFRGEKCPDGVYLWSILYWEYDGEVLYPLQKRGMMTLLRQ